MTIGEWFTLAGIVLGIVSGFAVPHAVWMTKMWSGQRVQSERLRSLGGRLKRLEIAKHDAHTMLANQIAASNTRLADQLSSMNDRINEHAEHIAVHETRLVTTETEIKDVRAKAHNLSNQVQELRKT